MPDNDEPDDPKLRATYDQLCESYRAIDDFRTKLLGFLPLVTGGGLILLTGRQEALRREFFLPVGIFGLAVTAALFSYEIFGIRKCHDMIILGRRLEDLLGKSGQFQGQFLVRRKMVGRVINEPFAAGIIYPSVMAAWMYLALFYTERHVGMAISIAIFLLGFILTFSYDLRLGRYPNEPPAWLHQSIPSDQRFVVSPRGRKPSHWVVPAEKLPVVPVGNCPPEDARLRVDLVPLWVWAWYKLPTNDRHAHAVAWMCRHGFWEIRPSMREQLLRIYAETKTIAVVGASADPSKAAHQIPRYLQSQGYRILPVNPRGGELLGEAVARSLAEVDRPVDVVEVFRPAGDASEIAREAIAIGAKVLWLQLGIESGEAKRLAEAVGLTVVMNRCMGATHGELGLGPGPD